MMKDAGSSEKRIVDKGGFNLSWETCAKLIISVLFVVVQQIEANFIYPRVVGKQVGLTGMWPLIGVTLASRFSVSWAPSSACP